LKDNHIRPFPASENELTESIHVGDMYPLGLDTVENLDSIQGKKSPFVSLLDALPIPALLVDRSCAIVFANEACGRIGLNQPELSGKSFCAVFDRSTDGTAAETLAKRVLCETKPLVSEGILEIGQSRMWCRMHLRSLKIGTTHSVLVLLEDLTAERKQFLATKKRSKELLKAHDELEDRVQERTAELAKVNESLRREIAERGKAERRVRVSEEKYKDLAELLPQIVYEIDLKGHFTFINRSGLEVLGYTSDELAQDLSTFRVFSPRDVPRFFAAFHSVMQGNKSVGNEYLAMKKDGTVFPVMAYSAPIVRDGRVLGVRGVCVDITERKRSEQALQESEQHYRLLTERSLAGICIIRDDVAVYVNDRYCGITGYSREEIIGKSMWETVHPEDTRKIRREATADPDAREQAAPYELRFVCKNGAIKWLEAIDILISHQGKPALLVNIADITERKSAEESLRTTLAQLKTRDVATTEELLKTTGRLNQEIFERIRIEDALDESERRYRTLVETAKDIIWTVDSDLRFTYVSPAVTRVLGYTVEEIMSLTPLEIITPGSREDMRRAFAQEMLLATEGTGEIYSSRSEEIEHRHKDGSVRWMEVTLTWLRGVENSPLGLLGISRDITHRKEDEDVLQKALRTAAQLRDEAEAANRAKGDFLASMSHELRTPLNAIIGFSEILEDQTFGDLNSRQLRYVSHVLTSGRHLLLVINDILDLAKIESGKMELQISRVNMMRLLENSLVMIKEKALKHHLRVSLHVDDDLANRDILADELKLKQIMFNLLSNAAKFTPDGGAIKVEATADAGNVAVRVSDTGIGVNPPDRERIFGTFEQVNSSYGRAQQGTGLGLTLTRRMVELHNGRVWAESDGEGKGSTFAFVIPLFSADAAEQERLN
jgi:PAS domain S-box-containing protein